MISLRLCIVLCDLSCSCHVFMFIICVFVGVLLYNIPNKRIEPKIGFIIIFKPCYIFIVKYCPGQNFIIKFNEILSMEIFPINFVSWTLFHRGKYFMIQNK